MGLGRAWTWDEAEDAPQAPQCRARCARRAADAALMPPCCARCARRTCSCVLIVKKPGEQAASHKLKEIGSWCARPCSACMRHRRAYAACATPCLEPLGLPWLTEKAGSGAGRGSPCAQTPARRPSLARGAARPRYGGARATPRLHRLLRLLSSACHRGLANPPACPGRFSCSPPFLQAQVPRPAGAGGAAGGHGRVPRVRGLPAGSARRQHRPVHHAGRQARHHSLFYHFWCVCGGGSTARPPARRLCAAAPVQARARGAARLPHAAPGGGPVCAACVLRLCQPCPGPAHPRPGVPTCALLPCLRRRRHRAAPGLSVFGGQAAAAVHLLCHGHARLPHALQRRHGEAS